VFAIPVLTRAPDWTISRTGLSARCQLEAPADHLEPGLAQLVRVFFGAAQISGPSAAPVGNS